MITMRSRYRPMLVLATAAAAVLTGGLITVLVLATRGPAPLNALGPPASDTPVAAQIAGCQPAVAPVADAAFVPVAGRFGPAVEAYPPLIESGEVISEAIARQMPETLFPAAVPEAWSHELYVRDTMDRDADGRQEVRLKIYLSSKPVGGNVLEYMEAGGVLLVQASTAGVDAELVAREISDTGRQSTILEVGEHKAIMFLADPVIRDDLRPWHMYWSDGTRDWSLQGIADPEALIELARSIYC